jgi:hydrogenase nickel incorporation protein HypA/HybF
VHELSIAVALVETACEKAAEIGGPRIEAVHVEIGRLSGVVADALLFSFDVAAQGTPIEGAKLRVTETPGRELLLVALEVEDAEEDEARTDAANR